MANSLIYPVWDVPSVVHACATTRISPDQDHIDISSCYGGFNLASHVGEDIGTVQRNRKLLSQYLKLPAQPHWLQQTHSDTVIELSGTNLGVEADAAFTRSAGQVCVVMTADCLPVLLADRDGACVAAVHAGWRGLQKNIIAKTITKMSVNSQSLCAWLGPAISQSAYTVGRDVYDIFVNDSKKYAIAFRPIDTEHWQMDMVMVAKLQLQQAGVEAIYGGDYCTYKDHDRFYSYRRDGVTGRMASLIWLE